MATEIEQEALALGRVFLVEEGSLLDALYLVYDHYRDQFLAERELLDTRFSTHPDWVAALSDARKVERYVHDEWLRRVLADSKPLEHQGDVDHA